MFFINIYLSLGYHPQSDGQIERFNLIWSNTFNALYRLSRRIGCLGSALTDLRTKTANTPWSAYPCSRKAPVTTPEWWYEPLLERSRQLTIPSAPWNLFTAVWGLAWANSAKCTRAKKISTVVFTYIWSREIWYWLSQWILSSTWSPALRALTDWVPSRSSNKSTSLRSILFYQ